MLNSNEIKRIAQNIYVSNQDFFFLSSLYGEPFLFKNFIYFFDGECLSISGYPLNSKMTYDVYLTEINGLIYHCLKKFKVRLINYSGIHENPLPKDLMDSYELVYSLLPDKTNVDIILDLSSNKLLKTTNAKESLRKFKKSKIYVKKSQYSFYRYHHIESIRRLILRKNICLGDSIVLLNNLTLLHSGFLTFFEAEIENQFVGFAIVHEYFPNTPFLISLNTNGVIPNIADALHITILKHYSSIGAQYIGLGYSVNDGLLSYKTKWGGAIRNLPYHQSILKQKNYDLDSCDLINWISRLVELKIKQLKLEPI